MEQFHRTRSQSARVPSPSSYSKLIACDGPQRGSNLTARLKFPKVESDPRSCDCDKIMDKHKIAFESGQRPSKRPAGTPMKCLLADEMSKDSDYTTQAPGVIAKLMGLEGMPSQQSFYKQPKRSSDGFNQKTVPTGSLRHRKACNNQSCKKIAGEQYKDVYEVRESPRNRTAGCKSQVPANMTHAEDEIIIMTNKSVDAKRLSMDKNIHNSKEFHGETDVSDSSNYLLLKYLGEPDSLFARHLHNLHASQETHREHVRNLKVSNMLNNNIDAIGHLTDIEASNKIDISMSRECQVGLHHHVSRNRAKASYLDKSATFCPGENDLASDVPTNIILLKPNLEGLRKSAKFSSSSSSCELLSNGGTHKNGGCRQAESWGKKRVPIALDIDAHKSRESKELARQITQQMRHKLGDSFNVPLSGCRGYSADDISHEMSGNNSSYESYATFLTSHTSARPSFHRKSSALCYADSSVTKEAKKRLSERWEMSQRSEKFSAGTKGSTLGQMLAIYDSDVRLSNLDEEMTRRRPSSSFSRNRKFSGAAEPLGISSKDGWRDDCIGTLSRAEPLQTVYDRFRSPKTSIRYVACGTEKLLIPKEGSRNSRKKEVNEEFSWNEGSSTGTVKLCDKKVNDPLESQVGRKGKKNISQPKNSSVHEPVVLESSKCRLDTMLTLDSEMVKEHVKIPGYMGSSDDVVSAPEFTSLQVKNGSSSNRLHETAQEPSKACCIDSSQYCGALPESRASNKEADHPSPVSVLDTPFVEDLSSGSECFERVSAELHGLRMQLQLLKLETRSYATASILVSSDEDEPSPVCSEGAKRSDNWETSYKADMLAEYEFDGTSGPIVSPHVFENLEKKYRYPKASCSRSDRRLLFDQVNSCILEISQRFANPHPLMKPSKAWFELELCKLLEAELKQEKEDVAFLHSKREWMNLGKYVEELGCEIGEILLDELVFEALAM